ncbi:VOC family protein [Sciscionella sediminilitoris]|uniref:VOC family protein n=1 Tax=Sciscionella sediminilitoris TaxID=1445613 RepID=UPI0004DF3868|nr:VOC family protein [Sciscionella sp. SE31]
MTIGERVFAPGTPCWIDLFTSDKQRARQFYEGLLGWAVDPDNEEFGGYSSARADGAQVAGLMGHDPSDGIPDSWSTYFATADIGASAAAASEHGATVTVEPMPVGDLGKMAVLTDPLGAAFGLWEPGSFNGFEKVAENQSVVWTEYHSADFQRSVDFYAQVLGGVFESMADSEEFRYSTMRIGENIVAGMADLRTMEPDPRTSRWLNYFGIEDVDGALARVPELGGTVLSAAADSPHGRLADVADPTGAAFRLIDPSRATTT